MLEVCKEVAEGNEGGMVDTGERGAGGKVNDADGPGVVGTVGVPGVAGVVARELNTIGEGAGEYGGVEREGRNVDWQSVGACRCNIRRIFEHARRR